MKLFESFENAVGARIDTDRRQITPLNDAVLIQNEQGPLANSFLVAIRPVRTRNHSFWLEIGEQRKPKFTVLGIREMAPHAIDRDRNQRGIEAAKFGQQ